MISALTLPSTYDLDLKSLRNGIYLGQGATGQVIRLKESNVVVNAVIVTTIQAVLKCFKMKSPPTIISQSWTLITSQNIMENVNITDSIL